MSHFLFFIIIFTWIWYSLMVILLCSALLHRSSLSVWKWSTSGVYPSIRVYYSMLLNSRRSSDWFCILLLLWVLDQIRVDILWMVCFLLVLLHIFSLLLMNLLHVTTLIFNQLFVKRLLMSVENRLDDCILGVWYLFLDRFEGMIVAFVSQGESGPNHWIDDSNLATV